MNNAQHILVSVQKDNSLVIVEEHEIICDIETVKPRDEVIVICRNRDTGKRQEYEATVIMTANSYDELVKERERLLQLDSSKKGKQKADKDNEEGESDEVLKDLLGRGRRLHKPKRYEEFNCLGNSKSADKTAPIKQSKRKSSNLPREKEQDKKHTVKESGKKKRLIEGTLSSKELALWKTLNENPVKQNEASLEKTCSPSKEELKALLEKAKKKLLLLKEPQQKKLLTKNRPDVQPSKATTAGKDTSDFLMDEDSSKEIEDEDDVTGILSKDTLEKRSLSADATKNLPLLRDYAFQFARRPNSTIKQMSTAEVKRSLGSKLSELRQKYHKEKKKREEAKTKEAKDR